MSLQVGPLLETFAMRQSLASQPLVSVPSNQGQLLLPAPKLLGYKPTRRRSSEGRARIRKRKTEC